MFFESFLLNLSVLGVLIAALIFDYVTKFFSYWYIRHIPYKTPIPFFGSDYHSVFGVRNTTQEVESLYKCYPNDKFVGIIKGRIPDLIIKDPISIQKILSTDFSNFHYRGSGLDKSRDVCIRNNLFYSEGEKWTLLRGKLDLILNHMDDDIQEGLHDCLSGTNGYTKVQQLLSEILDVVFKDLLLDNNSDMFYIKNLRLLSENRTLSGKIKSYLKNNFPSLYLMFEYNIRPQQDFQMNHILKNSKLNKKIQNSDVISNDNAKSKKALESDTEICYSILNLFISEGYIPCYNLLTSLLYEVAKDNEVQNNIRKCILSNSDDYLDAVIKESLRLHPTHSIITRKCTKMYNFPEKDLQVDKGITVTIPVEEIHKDEKYYKEAESFRPDRFLQTENVEKSTFIPFGMGPRKCVGK